MSHGDDSKAAVPLRAATMKLQVRLSGKWQASLKAPLELQEEIYNANCLKYVSSP